jgi:L-galactono-1,4-lactone dehydrogenase
MSPAFSQNPKDVFSWVGIIMYLPPKDGASDDVRRQITDEFQRYCSLLQPLIDKYNGQVHWAKLELPSNLSESDLHALKHRIRNKFPIDNFNSYRKALDPSNILSNKLIDTLINE